MTAKQAIKLFIILLVIIANGSSNVLFAKSLNFSDHSANISSSEIPLGSIPFIFQPLVDDMSEDDETVSNSNNLNNFFLGNCGFQVLAKTFLPCSNFGTKKRHLWRINSNFRL